MKYGPTLPRQLYSRDPDHSETERTPLRCRARPKAVTTLRVSLVHCQRHASRARGRSIAPPPLLLLQRPLTLREAPRWTVRMQRQRLTRRVSWGERGRRPADLQHSRAVAGLRDVGHRPCVLLAFSSTAPKRAMRRCTPRPALVCCRTCGALRLTDTVA